MKLHDDQRQLSSAGLSFWQVACQVKRRHLTGVLTAGHAASLRVTIASLC